MCSDLIALFCFCLRSLLRKHVFFIIPQRNVGSVDYLCCQWRKVTVKFYCPAPINICDFKKMDIAAGCIFFILCDLRDFCPQSSILFPTIFFFTAAAEAFQMCLSSFHHCSKCQGDGHIKRSFLWLTILEVSLDWLTLAFSLCTAIHHGGSTQKSKPADVMTQETKAENKKRPESTFPL